MANFLTLNGIVVPCSADQGGSSDVDQVGASKRASDGTMRVHRRVTKRKWEYELIPQEAPTGTAFRDLVLGKGHYWSFDDTAGGGGTAGLYSSKGLGPTGAITGVTLGTAAPAPWLGAGRVAITAGNSLAYALGLQVGLTALVAVNVNSAGWNHIIKDDTGTVYTNGALAGAAAMIALTLATGTVTLSAPAVTHQFDELIILPFRIPSDWPAQIYAFQNPAGGNTQWSKLAQLKAAGDGIDANLATVTVKGEPGSLSIMPGTKTAAGGFKPNLHKMRFTLEEI